MIGISFHSDFLSHLFLCWYILKKLKNYGNLAKGLVSWGYSFYLMGFMILLYWYKLLYSDKFTSRCEPAYPQCHTKSGGGGRESFINTFSVVWKLQNLVTGETGLEMYWVGGSSVTISINHQICKVINGEFISTDDQLKCITFFSQKYTQLYSIKLQICYISIYVFSWWVNTELSKDPCLSGPQSGSSSTIKDAFVTACEWKTNLIGIFQN